MEKTDFDYSMQGYKIFTYMNMRVMIQKIVGRGMLESVLNFVWGAKKPNIERIHAGNDSVNEIEEYLALCDIPRSVAMQM
ncbi:MAG: hypothetical protein II894_04640, partial [Bacteroidales bacterium]|nr:hypothetical protein [Bacteroidales bacterium]